VRGPEGEGPKGEGRGRVRGPQAEGRPIYLTGARVGIAATTASRSALSPAKLSRHS
jgi:hypothetical protein